MSDPIGSLPDIDRLIHEPARLRILTALAACVSADFLFLEGVTGLSRGNLSVQLTKLQEAGLIWTNREIVNRKTRTSAALTPEGSTQLTRYWQSIDQLRKNSKPLKGTKA